jgi:WD40 repeat protein
LAFQGTIWDAATGNRLIALKNAAGTRRAGIDTIAFSPDGKRVVGTTSVSSPLGDGTPGPRTNGVWDAETGELLATTSAVNGAGSQTFSPDGKRLAGGGKIWDAHTGQFLLSLSSGNSAQVTFSPDGHRLAVVDRFSNEVTIYDATPLPEKP